MNKCRPEYVAALLTLLLGCCYPCWFSVTRTLLVPLENPALPGMLYPRGTHLPGAKASPLPVVSLILAFQCSRQKQSAFPDGQCVVSSGPTASHFSLSPFLSPLFSPFPPYLLFPLSPLSCLPNLKCITILKEFYHDYMSSSVQNIEKPCPNKTCRPKKGDEH